jgi:uncharacterized protein YprB with RNaseH-like and TPR domain
MLENLSLENLLFLDIETIPAQPHFDALSPHMQELWLEKFTKTAPDSPDPAEGYGSRAAIYAEFGKIVCISAGYFDRIGEQKSFRIKSFYGEDEPVLLEDFLESVRQFNAKKPKLMLCGHNIREFDIPYICRRALIRGITLPDLFRIYDKKPWELMHLDTMQLWRFGDHKNYSSLKLLAGVMDIPSPKDDIDGAMVGKLYWEQKDLVRIATYCQKDVLTVAQLILRFRRAPLLTDEHIEIIS